MNPISDNLYDVALTAIRNCQWQGSEVEKVVRAVQELEQHHDAALRLREKHPMVAGALTPEAAKAVAAAGPGEIVPVVERPMTSGEKEIAADLDKAISEDAE